jgi:hypothetical protein
MKTNNRNTARAKRCNAVLLNYGSDDTTGCLIDFLVDARHWCDRHGESFAALDKRAHQYYAAELLGGQWWSR